MSIEKVIARAWTDADYKARLLTDSNAALAEHGFEVPAGTTIKVAENTVDTQHLVLPVAPAKTGEGFHGRPGDDCGRSWRGSQCPLN